MVELVDGHAHLGQISVLPEHGGQGVGTQLLDAVAGWAQGQGHAEITLTTFRDVPFNAPLYGKRGYEVVPDSDWTDGHPRPRRPGGRAWGSTPPPGS